MMAKMTCFPALLLAGKRRKKHGKVAKVDCPKVKPVEFIDATPLVDPRDAKVADADRTVPVAVAAAREGGGEEASVHGDCDSDFELEFRADRRSVGSGDGGADKKGEAVVGAAESASAKLKRSCSNIETKRPGPRDATVVPPARSRSHSDLTGLAAGNTTTPTPRNQPRPDASPASVRTSRTADHVMLKKRSSSQVLPSRSRKLWWRLFLWSHRNLHRPRSAARPAATAACSAAERHGGYTSDTHEEGHVQAAAVEADRKNKNVVVVDGSPPSSPVPNQWVAFCADNSLHDRVSAWVNSIENEPFHIAECDEHDHDLDGDDIEDGDGIEDGECAAVRPRSLELGESSSALELAEPISAKAHGGKSKRCAAADEFVQANSVVQSLNAFSSVAHISGMGLKVVPMIAPFSSLRAVNLSSNFIVHISPGSLPKGLHSLDLSRNKIATIEGLRELTKLRVLNLSYNRISRIGHGLSNCTAIRELYLAGNKISDVEGLHRLLKLTVLDLSFNKITTAKALGQLVANYHSLLALNLVGNPVQANVGDDALRRAVTGLLPSLAYLNKQPVKPQRSAREVATDSVARAALAGGGGRNQRRRAPRRLGSVSGDGIGRSRSKGRYHGSGSTRK